MHIRIRRLTECVDMRLPILRTEQLQQEGARAWVSGRVAHEPKHVLENDQRRPLDITARAQNVNRVCGRTTGHIEAAWSWLGVPSARHCQQIDGRLSSATNLPRTT